jgi:hypothetical protein
VQVGLRKKLHQVIDLDLRSFFDTVRHDLLLAKIARRVRDDDLLWLCKRILTASGQRGIPSSQAAELNRVAMPRGSWMQKMTTGCRCLWSFFLSINPAASR